VNHEPAADRKAVVAAPGRHLKWQKSGVSDCARPIDGLRCGISE
jgi:hypothetical protein